MNDGRCCKTTLLCFLRVKVIKPTFVDPLEHLLWSIIGGVLTHCQWASMLNGLHIFYLQRPKMHILEMIMALLLLKCRPIIAQADLKKVSLG